jgi:Na+/serine symporter
LVWRSWNKYVLNFNPIGIIYLLGSIFTVTGFFALFTLKVLYILFGLSLFGVAAFSEILRNQLMETQFSNEMEVAPLNEW